MTSITFAERCALEPVEDIERFVVMTEVPA